FGRSIANGDGRFEFSASSRPFNSVRVLGDKSIGSSSGAVPLFFGNALGVDFFEPLNSATATYLDRDVVLVVDRSGSMRDDNKSVDLQSAITLFLDILDDSSPIERVGLASYNETSTRDVSLTTDSVSIRSAMGALEFDGRTSISRGLEDGGQIFLNDTARPFAERTIIVMTDGRHNEGPEPSIPAAEIANENIRIHTITFGENADRARMEQVAAIGGGRSYHAEDGDQLRDVYREIALTLSTIITE
ncbi:MAG: vWA domain-containing protein, partial [Planctomycetota bacterium]